VKCEIRVTLFEDNKSLRFGLYQLINGSEGLKCAGAFEDCVNLLKDIEDTKPNVVLMDIQMPGMDGMELLRLLRARMPSVDVIMMTAFDDLPDDWVCPVCGVDKTNFEKI
jgi:DNA-binding NarL/FixJ family response regulator